MNEEEHDRFVPEFTVDQMEDAIEEARTGERMRIRALIEDRYKTTNDYDYYEGDIGRSVISEILEDIGFDNDLDVENEEV
jgi:hypothetical protein